MGGLNKTVDKHHHSIFSLSSSFFMVFLLFLFCLILVWREWNDHDRPLKYCAVSNILCRSRLLRLLCAAFSADTASRVHYCMRCHGHSGRFVADAALSPHCLHLVQGFFDYRPFAIILTGSADCSMQSDPRSTPDILCLLCLD